MSAYLPNPRVSCVLAEQVARALVNKGVALGALDRIAEAIAVFDDLLARFGTATELPLRVGVARALFSKGGRLGALDRIAEAIAVYDDLLARFGTATELPLREWVAKAELRRRRGLPHIRIERLFQLTRLPSL